MPDGLKSTVPVYGSPEHGVLVAEWYGLIGPLLDGTATAEQRAALKSVQATLDEAKKRARMATAMCLGAPLPRRR